MANKKQKKDPMKLGNAPRDLPEEAREYWRRIHAIGKDHLTSLDAPVVELACRSYAEYQHANDMVTRAEDPTVKLEWMRVADLARKALMAALAELGLSPLGRKKLGLANPLDKPEGEDDPESDGGEQSAEEPKKQKSWLEQNIT